MVHRHNDVRDLMHSFCIRARLNNLELEKAGSLEDESITVELRRPADVLVEGLRNRAMNSRMWSKTALDVKVINGLGRSHLQASSGDGLAAAEIYRQEQIEHLRTGELCAAQDISYQPLVFTAQCDCERHAEALISQIATSVAKCENSSAMEVKAEMMQRIALCLARSAAKAIDRRRNLHCTTSWLRARRQESVALLDVDDAMDAD